MEPIVAVVLIIGLAWGASQLQTGNSDDHNKRNVVFCFVAQCKFIILEEGDKEEREQPLPEEKENESSANHCNCSI